jgi:hypothetical protein
VIGLGEIFRLIFVRFMFPRAALLIRGVSLVILAATAVVSAVRIKSAEDSAKRVRVKLIGAGRIPLLRKT